MNPDGMIIRTTRSRLGRLLDAFLTILAWLGFSYLCAAGIRAVLQETGAGPGVPFWSALLPTMGTLTLYILVGLFNGIVLLVWALYNQYRFAGLDRRKPVAALGGEELARSFGLCEQRLAALHQAKVAVVGHENDGTIAALHLSAPLAPGDVPARAVVAAGADRQHAPAAACAEKEGHIAQAT